MAHEILGLQHEPPELEVQSLNHWAAGKSSNYF